MGSTKTNDDPYSLSELDRMIADMYMPFLFTYKLSSPSDRHHIVNSIQRGLDKAVDELPMLAAAIPLDDAKRPLTRMQPAGPLKLVVRNFEEGEYMSYDELAEWSFPPADFDVFRLLPYSQIIPANPALDKPAENARKTCFVQLNFIPGGGIILGIGANHMAMDVHSVSLALTLICAKACMKDSVVPR